MPGLLFYKAFYLCHQSHHAKKVQLFEVSRWASYLLLCTMFTFSVCSLVGFFKVAVLPALPVKGVDFVLSNDIARDKIVPAPEVLDSPDLNPESDCTGKKV